MSETIVRTEVLNMRRDAAQTSANWRSLDAAPGAWMMPEFLAQKGVEYQGQHLPKGFRLMTPQLCFYNAARLIRRRKAPLRYCEGYVQRFSFPIPIHHAWVVDANDRVIDPTLRQPEEYYYLGFPMTLDQRDRWTGRHSQSVFDTGRGMNIKFMIETLPALCDLITEKYRKFLPEILAS